MVYPNRDGGPRYKVLKLYKFISKHFYDKQNIQLNKKEKVNTTLFPEAFLTSEHKPIYLKSFQRDKEKRTYFIKDELGFIAVFPERTEILIERNNELVFEKIEDIKVGDFRVLNFEDVPDLHSDVKNNFLSIVSKDFREVMCEGINHNVLCERKGFLTKKTDELNRKDDIQTIYFLEVKEITFVGLYDCYNLDFLPFSHFLKKDRTSNKTNYSNKINKLRSKKYLNKMRDKFFNIKKDKFKIEMELKNV